MASRGQETGGAGDGRRRITDDRQVTLAVRTLNQELTCPVCLGIMQETKVVIQCMHRFCGECIEKCLRQGKAECPSCRVHVGSRRSLARAWRWVVLGSRTRGTAAFHMIQMK